MSNTALAVGITEDRCSSLHFYSLPLSRKIRRRIFLKLENLQVARASKTRGNANKIALLNRKDKDLGKVNAVVVYDEHKGKGIYLLTESIFLI